VNPFFSYGSIVRVPEDDQLDAGMCSGCEYQQHLGKDDILFSADQIASFCNSCVDPKPDLCTTLAPVNATPVPVDDRCDDPPPPCEDPLNSPGCGRPAAEAACAMLEGTGCYEGCIFDYCAGDCQETGEEDSCEEPPPEPPVEPNSTTSLEPTTTTDYTRPPVAVTSLYPKLKGTRHLRLTRSEAHFSHQSLRDTVNSDAVMPRQILHTPRTRIYALLEIHLIGPHACEGTRRTTQQTKKTQWIWRGHIDRLIPRVLPMAHALHSMLAEARRLLIYACQTRTRPFRRRADAALGPA